MRIRAKNFQGLKLLNILGSFLSILPLSAWLNKYFPNPWNPYWYLDYILVYSYYDKTNLKAFNIIHSFPLHAFFTIPNHPAICENIFLAFPSKTSKNHIKILLSAWLDISLCVLGVISKCMLICGTHNNNQ